MHIQELKDYISGAEAMFRAMPDDETVETKAKVRACREQMQNFEKEIAKVKRDIMGAASIT